METDRFLIKKLTSKNANKNYLNWFKDSSVKKYIVGAKKNISLNYLKNYIKYQNNKRNTLFFGIFNKQDKHIGNIKFDNISKKKNYVIVGILIGNKKYRGIGLTQEIIKFFSDFFYKQYKIKNIFLGVDINNKNAIKAYIKTGFSYSEGKDHSGVIYMVKKYKIIKKFQTRRIY
jgi:ribosomal-protein-alanine N-acetyltransferase